MGAGDSPEVMAAVTAASIALPPCCNTARPAELASGWLVLFAWALWRALHRPTWGPSLMAGLLAGLCIVANPYYGALAGLLVAVLGPWAWWRGAGRSLAAGFAGIRNELFDNDNTIMVEGAEKGTAGKTPEKPAAKGSPRSAQTRNQ